MSLASESIRLRIFFEMQTAYESFLGQLESGWLCSVHVQTVVDSKCQGLYLMMARLTPKLVYNLEVLVWCAAFAHGRY